MDKKCLFFLGKVFLFDFFNETANLIVLIKNILQLESSKMKTNYLLLLLVFSFLALTSFSISTNSISKIKKTESVIEKDTFNIMASHGIFLRDSANLTSKKLTKLPYATKLILLNQDIVSEELTIQETKYFEIKGRMQKVKVVSQIDSLNNLEGYVFDGYLTKFPMPVLNYKGTTENDYLSADLNYFQTNFKVNKKYNIKKYRDDCSEECICGFEQKFGSVIEYQTSTCEEIGTIASFKFNGLTIREAYFIGYILFFQEATNNEEYEYEGDVILFDKKLNQIRIEPKDQGAGCYYKMTKKNGFVLFEFDCVC